MTITRLAQFSAETRVLTDIAWVSSAIIPVISSTQAKTGTYSYQINTQKSQFGKHLVTPVSAVRMGYWQYLTSTTMEDSAYIFHSGMGAGFPPSGSNSGVNRIEININNASGFITARRPSGSGTLEDLASVPIPGPYGTTGTWFHVGITHKIDAVDGFISVYVEGTRVLNYTGDTRPTHWNGSTLVYEDTTAYVLGPGTRNNSFFGFVGSFVDDMYVDSIVGEEDDPVPSRRFMMVLPTGAGEDAEWTPIPTAANYLNVDDNPNDGDSTYNKALAADLRDTFAMGDITLPVDHRIVAVIPTPFVKRLDSEIQHQLSVHAWDGLQYEDSADLDLTMSYDVPAFARFPLQPDGSAWNETDFNAMQFGYRSRGTF